MLDVDLFGLTTSFSQRRARALQSGIAIKLPEPALRAELYRQFRASGLRKIDLASRMGFPKTVVDRLFDLDHHTRMNQIEAAFAALGKRIGIVVKNAA